MTKQMRDGPVDPTKVVQLKVHGGLGDLLWVHKVFCTYQQEIFYHISNEHRARPRRAGILADHLPNVAGWRFDETSFCLNGQDWGPATDPACALKKTWAEIAPPPGKILRIECNRHIESGKRLDDWLPDLPTTHHFDFLPCEPSERKLVTPYVVFHLAGWPDVPDPHWVRAIDSFIGVAHCYIVGGSYDNRPRKLRDLLATRRHVSLLEDLPWNELHALLKGAMFCFGHASGLTAIADVMRVPGATVNPGYHPKLIGTWNGPDHKTMLHIRADEFPMAVAAAANVRAVGSWPPDRLTPIPEAVAADIPGAVRGVARMLRPRTVLVFAGVTPPESLAAAALHGAYDEGAVVSSVHLVARAADAAVLTKVYQAAGRSSRRATISPDLNWPPTHLDPFDLIVVHTHGSQAEAVQQAREGWQRVATGGGLLLTGPGAQVAAESLGASLRVRAAAVGVGFWLRKNPG